jgi:eukaryotic-like serine/threonine-protein kinase
MAGDSEGAARRSQDGIAVSSGESSAATPKPALGSDGMTDPGVGAADVTSPATPLPITPKSDPSDALTAVRPRSSGSASPPHPIFSSIGATVFHEGDILGERYEILKLLGMGGMGAVYKARDLEVDRVVGLKVIRPDLAGDPAILARFKQELILARQVTHKNIIRIYDLNEAGGVKFITMEFIEGEDLRSILLREGKLPPKEAAHIVVQVCAGLQAAHSEGVIHRDLKPSNVMRDASGRVVVMDFGLARTVQGDGMTRTGMMVGTMEYMSPEQAMGKDLDAASDQFTVGLIFYELLSGSMPYHAESAIASLVKRTQEGAVPLTEVDATIPPELSAIVSKCLERDPAARFASVQELIDEIEIWEGKKPRTGQSVIAPPLPKPAAAKRFPWKWVAVGTAAVVLAAGTYVALNNRKPSGTAATQAPPALKGPVTSVAILPFYNGSGDPGLNSIGSTISETLISDIGRSPHLRPASPEDLQEVLHDSHISPESQVDSANLKRVADVTGADTIITGQYFKNGEGLRINSTIHLKDGRNIPITTDVANEEEVLAAVDNLADQIRQKLAASRDILKELQANSQHVSTKSIPALRVYEEGLQRVRAGDYTTAVKKFEDATTEDANFAVAFAKLAETYSNLGNDTKAEQASRSAMQLRDNLPPRDRTLVEAIDATVQHDTDKAIAQYENLVKVNSDDVEAHYALAKLYEDRHDLETAGKHLDKVLAADAKNVRALYLRGEILLRQGNAQAALVPLNQGLSYAIQFDYQEEKAYIDHALGVAYRNLGRQDEAMRSFQDALAIRKKIDDQRGIAVTLGEIAGLQGTSDAAKANYEVAIAAARKIGAKKELARNLMNLGSWYHDHGKYDDALKLTKEALQGFQDIGDKNDQALCLNNIASNYDYKGDYQNALTYFKQAYEIQQQSNSTEDATESLRNLAEMSFKLGQYDAAQSQFVKALEASKTAGNQGMVALESSTMGVLFAAQGKYDAAISSLQEAVKGFQQLKDRTWYSVEAQARLGDVLSIVGQGAEGQKYIDSALKLAEEVKDESATAEARNCLGDSYFYRGDYSSARQQYERARQIASKSALPDQGLRARLGLARLSLVEGKAQAALPELKKIKDEAESMGLKALSVQASIFYAQALLATNRAALARDELGTAVGQADKLGMLLEKARAEFLLGNAATQAGKPKEAPLHYREAARVLQSIINNEKSAARILDRPDLKAIYGEAKASMGGAA